MTKIIRTKNIQTVRNVKAKPWSHVSGPRSEFLVQGPQSLIPGHCLSVAGLESLVLGPGSWVLVFRSWVLESWATSTRSLVPAHSVIIKKCDKKLLQNVTGNTKCDRYYKVWQKIIIKCDGYYKVWQVLQIVTTENCYQM